jgi:hypothetical protein
MESVGGYVQYGHEPQMLQADAFPDDQVPTGQAVQSSEEALATTEDIDPAGQRVQSAAPSDE